MKYKNRLTEDNKMRKLMGLDLLKEGISGPLGKDDNSMNEIEKAQKMSEERALKEKEVKEGHYIDEDETKAEIDDDIKKAKNPGDGAEDESYDGHKFDKSVIGVDDDNIDEKSKEDEIYEDSEGEETDHYGEIEGHDHKEEEHLEDEEKMAPADRVREIEKHLDALKKDMGYDEDHEDRDEEGTDFYEQKTFKVKKGGKVINISESDIKKLSKLLTEEEDWMQDAEEDIEKRGTEGVFHKFCVDEGFEDGCSKGCWDKAKEKGGVWGRRAGLAKAFCESKK